MKLRLTFCLLTLVLFSLISCTKEVSKENGNYTGGNGDFYATINGTLWNADSNRLVLVSPDGVSINGLSKTGEQISMILPEFKTGVFTLNSSSIPYALYANMLDDAANVFVSNTAQAGGTITITAIDTVNKLVSGSFQFNLTNPADNTTKTITEGIFSYILYKGDGGGITPTPPGGSSDTLKALVDGNLFDAVQVQTTVANSPTGGTAQLLIAGIAANGTQDLALLMPANVTPGTYDMDFTAGNYIGIYYPSPSVTLVSVGDGKLTIISNNTVTKHIKGTFSFLATPFTSGTPANITQGYFSVNY